MNIIRRGLTLAGAAVAVAATFSSLPARASDATEAKELVDKSNAVVSSFVNDKDFTSIGPLLGRAKAVLIFPQIVKIGFVLGGSGGSGVLLVRDGKTGNWTGPAFYTLGSASIGFAAGASAAEVMMVVTTQKALDALYTNKLKLGADASIAAGPKGAGTSNSFTSDFIAYSKDKGVYAGVVLDGAVLDVRDGLNGGYYGKKVTPVEILVKHAASNPEAATLQAALKNAAK
jgi:SH3 domain-containing YSC84-like protein 1